MNFIERFKNGFVLLDNSFVAGMLARLAFAFAGYTPAMLGPAWTPKKP